MEYSQITAITAEYQDAAKVERVQKACEFNGQKAFCDIRWVNEKEANELYIALLLGTELSTSAATRITEVYFTQILDADDFSH